MALKSHDEFRNMFPVLAELVMARNIANVPDIEKFLQGFETGDDKINKWLMSAMRKYLINTYDKVKPYRAREEDPDWMKGKDDLEAVKLDDELHDTIEHTVDYIKNLIAENPSFQLEKFQAPEAIKQAGEWAEQLKKKKTEQEVEGKDFKVLKQYDDGYAWKQLISENALAREGNLMGHCVGGYWAEVKSGAEIIISLRDAKNEPHCTIEYIPRRRDIAQIKGKQNQGVKEEYRKYVVDFLNSHIVPYKKIESHDLKRNALLQTTEGVIDAGNIPDGTTLILGDDTFEANHETKIGKNVTIKGNFTAGSDWDVALSDNLTVTKNFDASETSALPKGLKVRGDLNAVDSGIEELPPDLKVSGSIHLDFSGVSSLPKNFKVGLNLSLGHTSIKKLPPGLVVGGELDIMDTEIRVLPPDLKVGDAIYVDDETEMEIPENLKEQVY
jgi:hypothetical protein